MIWYELSKNNLQVPDPKKYTLVCTYLSLMELAFSPNNFKNLSEVQEAVRHIFVVKPEIILDYPTDHAKSLIDNDFHLKHEIESDLTLAFLRVLLNHPKEGLISNSFKDQLENISNTRKNNMAEWAEFMNELYQDDTDIRRALKKYSQKDSDVVYFKKWFLHRLNDFEEDKYSSEKMPWELFEFYISIGAHYMRTMKLSRMKADGNDENDLRNMIYVQPRDKYWTLEKKWLTFAREAKMSQYLYHPNDH